VQPASRLARPEFGYQRDMDNKDQAKGKLQQAIGDLTGDKSRKHKGQADEKAGDAKALLTKLGHKADDAVDRVKHALTKD